MHKSNTNNNIIDISNFHSFSPDGFYFKSKIIEGSHKVKKCFFNFRIIFLKMFKKCLFFFLT